MFPGSMVGQIFADQIEVTIRHHALESGCFVVNATGWLTPEQRARIAQGTALESALSGGCFTAIVSPEGALLGRRSPKARAWSSPTWTSRSSPRESE